MRPWRRALGFVAALQLMVACEGSAARPSLDTAPAPSCEESSPAGTLPVSEERPLPDLAWEGVDGDGAARTLRLYDYHEPCAARPRLLVVRVTGGAWCGTCRWHAAHTGELAALPVGDRLRRLDLVVGDRDNAPASARDLPTWRALLDAPSGVAIGADPGFALRALGPAGGVALPFYVFVDTRTMRVRGAVSNPAPAALASRVERLVAELDGAAPPPPREEALYDGIFRRDEWDMIRDVATLGAPPPDPTNAAANRPAAVALGKALFSDTTLSPSGALACITCHDPARALADGAALARGAAEGRRHTPRIALAAFSPWQFWDGRADTLWAQALGPFENPSELASSRLFVVRRLVEAYLAEMAAAFPELALPARASLPSDGMPGVPAYDALPEATRDAVTRAFVAAGKALAAYERTFRVAPNALDRYASGDRGALSAEEKQGLSLFARVGCMQCHWGPRLTDDAFHVTRPPSTRADRGRIDGLALLAKSEFAAGGRYSDAPRASLLEPSAAAPSMLGAFKTPTLRGVAHGGPFGHGGAARSLFTIAETYAGGGAREDDANVLGALEPWLPRFDLTAAWALPPFLETLEGRPIMP